jgi:hypothetical protein
MKQLGNFGFAWRSIASVAACAVVLAGCASEVMPVPHLEANQHVAAHQYDQEWFNAAREGRWDILDALLRAGYPIESVNSSGYTALILAAYDNHPDTLDKLMAAGANAGAADHNGNTASDNWLRVFSAPEFAYKLQQERVFVDTSKPVRIPLLWCSR